MADVTDRVHAPVSTRELERRWAAIRSAMEGQRIDVLVLQNNGDHVGGYVKYLTDVPATNGYPLSVVFPQEDLMTIVAHGPLGGHSGLPYEGDGLYRGAGRLLTTASFASASYSRTYDARLVLEGLRGHTRATIGLVGTGQMSHAFAQTLRDELPGATFVEASDLLDPIKAIKSTEEQELIRRTAALQDEAMRVAFAAVEPGKRDRDIAAVAQHAAQDLGAEQGVYLCASAPALGAALIAPPHLQARSLREGDVFNLLIESNGPGGFYTELGRTCVLGAAPQQLVEETEFAVQAQQFSAGLLKAGVAARDAFAAYNDFMREHGRPPEQRIHSHGQGYDMVERPLIRADETLPVERDMTIAVHPTYVQRGLSAWICDTFLIDGPGPERLHAFSQEITEL